MDDHVRPIPPRQATLEASDDEAIIYLDDVPVVKAGLRHGHLQVNWLIYGPVWPAEAQALMTEFIHLTAWLDAKQGAIAARPLEAVGKRRRRVDR